METKVYNTKVIQVHTADRDGDMEYVYDILDNGDGSMVTRTANSPAWSHIYRSIPVLRLVDDGSIITITKENGDVITLGYEAMEQMLALLTYAYDGRMQLMETNLIKFI